MKKSVLSLFAGSLLGVSCFVSSAVAEDWPQFRGSGSTGISPETGLLTEWPAEGPALVWKAEGLGVGWSSACVVDNNVYIAGMDPQTKIGSVFAFDAAGKQLWKTAYGPEWDKSFPGSRNTPTYANGRVYYNSGLNLVTCYDAKDGKQLWAVDTAAICGSKSGMWGGASSVAIYNDLAITAPGGTTAGVIALNAQTGAEVWKTTDFAEEAVYCTPVVINHKGVDMVVVALKQSTAGIDAKTGKMLWKVPHSQFEPAGGRDSNVRANSPVYADGRVFVASGYEKGSVALELADDGLSAKVAGFNADLDPQMGGIVKVGDYIYGSNTNNPNQWMCLNFKDAKEVYKADWEKGKGSLIAAEGNLYCYNEQTGAVALVKADPAGFKITSQFKLPGGTGEHWAHPAISNGKLYVHHGDTLFVYNIKK